MSSLTCSELAQRLGLDEDSEADVAGARGLIHVLCRFGKAEARGERRIGQGRSPKVFHVEDAMIDRLSRLLKSEC